MKLKPKLIRKLIALIVFLDLSHKVTQHQWGRKLFGGGWYLIRTNLTMADFWSSTNISSCGGRSIALKFYDNRE